MRLRITILTTKFTKIFLLKLSYKTHVLNLMLFQGEMVNFFLKNEALRRESVKITSMPLIVPNNYILNMSWKVNIYHHYHSTIIK